MWVLTVSAILFQRRTSMCKIFMVARSIPMMWSFLQQECVHSVLAKPPISLNAETSQDISSGDQTSTGDAGKGQISGILQGYSQHI